MNTDLNQLQDRASLERLLFLFQPIVAEARCEWLQHLSSDAPFFLPISLFSPNENKLSKAIAELLNPKGSHDQGALFLELFLKRLKQPARSVIGVRVRCEFCTNTIERDRRRMDILIEAKDRSWGIGIENKPWASEGDQQLSDYVADLRNRYRENFVMLRIAGYESDPTSLDKVTLKRLTSTGRFVSWHYQAEFCEWLKECHRTCKSPRVQSFLDELMRYSIAKFGKDPFEERHFMNQKLVDPMDNLITTPEQMRAYAQAVELFPAVRQKRVTDLFDAVERRVLERLGEGWSFDERSSENFVENRYPKFRLQHRSWGNIYSVCLESQPDGNRVILGMWCDKKHGLKPDKEIYRLLDEIGWADDRSNDPWWNGFTPLPAPYTDWTLPSTIAHVANRGGELEDLLVDAFTTIATQMREYLGSVAVKSVAAE